MPWLGPLTVMVALLIHFYFAKRPRRELMLILSAAIIGAGYDSLLLAAGWVQYSSGLFSELVAPYWIITMWMLFATTLNVTFRWLHGRWALAALMGAFFGPMSYLAGSAAGAVELVNPLAALSSLGVAWALLMPGLLLVARELDGTLLPAFSEPGVQR